MIFESFEFKPAAWGDRHCEEKARCARDDKGRPRCHDQGHPPAPAKGTARGKAAAKGRDRWITHTGVSFEGLWNVQMPTKPEHTTEPGLFGVKVPTSMR